MSDSDTFIKCGICSENFDKPKILPCFHTVCNKCLENIVDLTAHNGRFECPFCRMGIAIPENGASGFQTNFYIKSLDTVYSKSEMDCDVCGTSRSAMYECKQCDQKLCKSCSNIHSRISSSANHSLATISTGERPSDKGKAVAGCEFHQSEHITKICKECNKLVCDTCISEYHEGHYCKSVSEEAEERRDELRELLVLSENIVTDREKDIRDVKRQSESKYKYFNEQVSELRKTKDSLIAKINEIYKSYEEEIKHLNDEQLILSNQMNESQKNCTAKLNKTIEKSRELVETIEDVAFLEIHERVSRELKGIKAELAPAVSGKTLMERVEGCTSWLVALNQQIDDI